MKGFKKIISLLIAILIVLTIAGCAGNGGRKKGKRKISFWAGVSDANQKQYADAIKQFNDENSSIQVSLIPQSSDFSSNLSGTLRGSNPPDVVMVEDQY